jgi:hypothetical protein
MSIGDPKERLRADMSEEVDSQLLLFFKGGRGVNLLAILSGGSL